MTQALADFQTSTLPVMPATARALREQLDAGHTSHRDLEQTLLRDPAACIALYRAVEQSRPGSALTISSPAHALSMLGRAALEQILRDLPQFEDPGENPADSPAPVYSQAAHAAAYASALCELLGLGGCEEIATAALLQQPAVLALWQHDPQASRRALQAVRGGTPYEQAFGSELGEPLAQANRRLAKAWHLPQLARDTLGDWNPFDRRAQLVMLADRLAQTSAAGWPGEQALLHTEILEDVLQTDFSSAASWWHRCAVDAARELHPLGYPLPAFELLRLPGDEPAQEDTQENAPETVAQAPADTAAEQTTAAVPDKRPPDLQTTIASVMKRMQSEAGIGRAVFAMLNRERTELRARMALGCDKQDPIRQFRLDPRHKHLFGLLVGKQQSIWVKPDNRARYAAYLKPLPLDERSQPGFYAMSLFVREKPLGLIFADCGSLSEAGYKQFRVLCREVTRTLAGED